MFLMHYEKDGTNNEKKKVIILLSVCTYLKSQRGRKENAKQSCERGEKRGGKLYFNHHIDG